MKCWVAVFMFAALAAPAAAQTAQIPPAGLTASGSASQRSAAAATFVQSHPNVGIDNIQLRAPMTGCPALEDSIRLRAFGDARRRAEALARDAGVMLGNPTALIEVGGCPSDSNDVGRVPVDPTTLTTTMTVTVTVTFAVK